MPNLNTLRARRARPQSQSERLLADQLYVEYCARPQHANRLTQRLKASLRAAANQVARNGLPPGYSQRLGYHAWKKRRKKALAIAIYGDPSESDTQTLIDLALRDVPRP